MEDILQQIIKEATGTKLNHLRNGAQNALGNYTNLRFHQFIETFCNSFQLKTNCIVNMEFTEIEIHRMNSDQYRCSQCNWHWKLDDPNL